MSTLPIHTVQHVKSVFKKYQIIAMLFTGITVIAAFMAAVSGYQLAELRKMQQLEAQMAPAPAQPAPAAPDDNLNKQIEALEDQLATERTTAQQLRLKIKELENKLTASKEAPAKPTPPAPEPSKPAIETEVKPSPGPSDNQEPETKSMMPAKPAETAPPSDTKPAVQPAQPAGDNNQSLQSPAPSPATNASAPQATSPQPPNKPIPAQPVDTPVQVIPKAAATTTAVPQSSPAKPAVVPVNNPQARTETEAGSAQTAPLKEETLAPVQNSAAGNQTKP